MAKSRRLSVALVVIAALLCLMGTPGSVQAEEAIKATMQDFNEVPAGFHHRAWAVSRDD